MAKVKGNHPDQGRPRFGSTPFRPIPTMVVGSILATFARYLVGPGLTTNKHTAYNTMLVDRLVAGLPMTNASAKEARQVFNRRFMDAIKERTQ